MKVWGSGCRVQGAGCGVQGAGFRVQGSGCRVQGAGFKVQGSGCRVQGSGFRAWGLGLRVKGLGLRVELRKGHTWRLRSTAASSRVKCSFSDEATQGQNDGFFSQLQYKCYLEEAASVGD